MDVIRRRVVAFFFLFIASASFPILAQTNSEESVVATFPKNFPPHYFLTPEGEPTGFAIEVITEVAREAKINLKLIPAENWGEANSLIRTGGADLIPNMGITPERAKYVFFTKPYESFSIRIFVDENRKEIHKLDDLVGKRVGTTSTNVANTLLTNINITRYEDASSAVKGLINGELDALILPDVVVKKLAVNLGRANKLKAVGKPLKEIQRAIGVSKDKPELYQKLEVALSNYLSSSEFSDTQLAWQETPKERWSIQHLTIFNVLFFIFLVTLIGSTLFKRLKSKPEGMDSSSIELRTISILGVFTVAILLSMGMSLWVLFNAAFDEQKARLVNIAQSRAKIIESVARFDLNKNEKLGIGFEESFQETVKQVREAHENLKGFGITGEFTFAKKIGDEISYILRQRHSDTVKPQNVSWSDAEAEPMRLALSGRSGTLVGLDYRGVEVLAAHEPVKVLDAGIVAKIDLAEIRLPYVKAGLISLAISQCILLLGYLFFSALASPILTKLSQAYLRLQALVDYSPNLIVLRNKRGEVILASPSAKNIESIQLDEGESKQEHKDGSIHTYLTTKFVLQSPDQIEFGLGQISVDISDRVAAETELKQYALAFESTSEGMVITDINGLILSVNNAFENITGYTREEVQGKNPSVVKSGRHDASFYEKLWNGLNNEGKWSGEIWNRRKNGEVYPEWLNINSVTSRYGEALFYVAVFSDITSLKRTQDELYYLAHHDPLTELPNRLLFKDRLDHALKKAHRDQEMVAVLALDLDRFKNINDSLGHPAGDKLLKDVSKRLSHLVRENDTVSRMGGDEFTIIAEGIDSFHSASLLAEKVVKGMVYDFNLGAQDVMTSVSVGISIYPQDGLTHEELLKNADTALYKAKSFGRNNYQFYTEDLSKSAFEKLVMENQISHGISNQEFSVYYQPQFDIKTDKLVSAEALVRWQHPSFGLITPDKFIPIAEENGLIVPLGEWVLETACVQANKWLNAGYEFERVAVNLAGQQLDRADLFETVKSILMRSGLPPHKLELEVTEGFIMDERRDSIAILEAFSDLGISVAIDDFGTGYSSLSYLKRLPIRFLKIDRSFVSELPHDDEDVAISRAVIALGHSLGMEIIAEGVEKQEQLDFLREEGCEILQGYLKGRPVSYIDFEAKYFSHDQKS